MPLDDPFADLLNSLPWLRATIFWGSLAGAAVFSGILVWVVLQYMREQVASRRSVVAPTGIPEDKDKQEERRDGKQAGQIVNQPGDAKESDHRASA